MRDLISWNESFETGLPIVDDEHRKLVSLTNRLCSMLLHVNPDNTAELDNVFVELASYAKYHFAEEEAFMGRSNLSQGYVDGHRREHRNFVEKVSSLWMNRNQDPERTFATLSAFLQTWICKHILVTDKEMAREVSERSGKEARPPDTPTAPSSNSFRLGLA